MMAPLAALYYTRIGKKEAQLYVLDRKEIEMAVKCLEKALEVYPHTTY